jgi:hypothetical protein
MLRPAVDAMAAAAHLAVADMRNSFLQGAYGGTNAVS